MVRSLSVVVLTVFICQAAVAACPLWVVYIAEGEATNLRFSVYKDREGKVQFQEVTLEPKSINVKEKFIGFSLVFNEKGEFDLISLQDSFIEEAILETHYAKYRPEIQSVLNNIPEDQWGKAWPEILKKKGEFLDAPDGIKMKFNELLKKFIEKVRMFVQEEQTPYEITELVSQLEQLTFNWLVGPKVSAPKVPVK